MGERSNTPSISVVGDRCCGCGACAAVCPVSCLAMEPDAIGFVHPSCGSGCIGCGKCAKACPVLTVGNRDETASVDWAKARDNELRERSSSGAVFGLLAICILDKGGVVYGAAFTNGCREVQHVRIDRKNDLNLIMRSKYVQSSIGADIYQEVAHDLRGGLCVLFSGTACEIAAMRNYFRLKNVSSANVLLVEVVCHGTPAPGLWKIWIGYISSEIGDTVYATNFRDKITGWSNYSVRYGNPDDSGKLVNHEEDWYMKAFLSNASLRTSCLSCPSKRCCGSDITLGDFWGIEKHNPVLFDDLGVSAVICNTEKGKSALCEISDSLEMGDSSFEQVVSGNPSVVHSVDPYFKRNDFLNDIANGMTIQLLMAKWTFNESFTQRVRGKLSGLKHHLLDGNHR